MAGGSSSSSKSTPVNMTPAAFQNLQQPFANVLGSLLGYSPSNTQQAGSSPQSGTPAQQAGGINNPQSGGAYQLQPQNGSGTQAAPGNGDTGGTMPTTGNGNQTQTQQGAATNGATTWTGGPTPGDANSVLSGIPSYQGQYSAPLTDNEQSLLTQLMGTTNNNAGAFSALASLLAPGGTAAPNVSTSQVQAGQITPQQIDTSNNGANSGITSGFTADQNNPLLQAYITASQRSTMDNLAQTLQNNGAQFTANGQFIQPGGSSAFDRAQALATQSAANASSDIASNIGYQGYELNQQLNQQTQQQNAANILSALQGNQSTDLTGQQSNQQANLTASEQNAANGLTASQSNATNALQSQQNTTAAATAEGNLNSQDVQDLVSNLQSQALPRLIEQYGLDQGLQQFNNQVNDLMTILQTGAGVTSPVIANSSNSSSNTKPNLL